jgi:hypothetical protein
VTTGLFTLFRIIFCLFFWILRTILNYVLHILQIDLRGRGIVETFKEGVVTGCSAPFEGDIVYFCLEKMMCSGSHVVHCSAVESTSRKLFAEILSGVLGKT